MCLKINNDGVFDFYGDLFVYKIVHIIHAHIKGKYVHREDYTVLFTTSRHPLSAGIKNGKSGYLIFSELYWDELLRLLLTEE